jgi:hypothetical protein
MWKSNENRMHLHLEVRKKCEFFWLLGIEAVDISQCCAKCFIGVRQSHVYWETNQKSNAIVDCDVWENNRNKAYYLCGCSEGFNWNLNTHVAFVPEVGSIVEIENDRISLVITNARRINFWDYVPNPPGNFTRKQRTCRNWIFANYVKDGMPL